MSLGLRALGLASRKVLADRVYDRILEGLMDGTMAAGAPVSIDAVARELDVSPTPVREALARLEATGLVTRAALKGYRVAPRLNADELSQLMDARRLIESGTAAAACARASTQLTEALRDAIQDMQKAPLGPSFTEFRAYWEADERFHRTIAEHAGNRFLLTAYQSLGGQVQRFRYFSGLGVPDADTTVIEHTAIVDAIEQHDPTAAAHRMDLHIQGAKERALRSMSAAEEPSTVTNGGTPSRLGLAEGATSTGADPLGSRHPQAIVVP